METTYLRTLIETVAKGSVSRAAERLFVTPSAVSRRIKFLEDLCGCPLLDRSGPTLKPTEAGRLILEKATEILAIERELMKRLRGVGDRRRISFCCTPAFGIGYLPVTMGHPNPTKALNAGVRARPRVRSWPNAGRA